MKNDKSKPMRVVLLPEEDGQPCREAYNQGKVGFQVQGLARTLYWADEGKTWKRAEESR